jgi:S1-C subfamily serine protease
MHPQNFHESVFFATVRIANLKESGTTSSVGTGFLLRAPLGDGDSVTLLISNRHVFSSDDVFLNFHRRASDGLSALLGPAATVHLKDNTKDSLFFHPDPNVDLACLNLSGILKLLAQAAGGLYVRFVGSEQIATFDEGLLHPGSPVWFVGYPAGRFDTVHQMPVLRTGAFASVPAIDFEGRPEFLIDAQVFPGSSGSPVFSLLDTKYKLVGVVARTMQLNGEVIGLGHILRATLVLELIDTVVPIILQKKAAGKAGQSVTEREAALLDEDT